MRARFHPFPPSDPPNVRAETKHFSWRSVAREAQSSRMSFGLHIYQHRWRSASRSSWRPGDGSPGDINSFFFERSPKCVGPVKRCIRRYDTRETGRNARRTKSTLKSFPRERCLRYSPLRSSPKLLLLPVVLPTLPTCSALSSPFPIQFK